MTVVLGAAVATLMTVGGSGRAPSGDAAPPPPGRFDHGAAGTTRNGMGGEIAPSATTASWPGTGPGRNGGPFAFIGAHYGSQWGIIRGPNNSMGVGYCVMEDLAGERRVSLQPDPSTWDAGEMARAAAVMASFGGDRVMPYAIDASGPYDLASGEWRHPALLGGGEYTRRRHIAVNFAVKMFVEDVSPSGVAAGRKLARDTAVVRGSGSDFPALQAGYRVAQHLARVADVHHAVGGITLRVGWGTPDGARPTEPGTYPLTVAVADSTGKPVGFAPVLQLSAVGIGPNRSVAARATVVTRTKSDDDRARWAAAAATGWPTLEMGSRLDGDPRFVLRDDPDSADVTDESGFARFEVTIDDPAWELAFHAQAPTANVDLYAGTSIQGQITWSGPPQSASTHQRMETSGQLSVRKVLDATDLQGDRDMSGFVFDVHRTSSPDAEPIATVTTGPGGRTDPVVLPVGGYRIVEVGRPAWATVLGDGGPLEVRVDAAPASTPPSTPVEVEYTNIVPDASISTRAVLAADAHAVVDEIAYRNLVPGTAYLARGALFVDSCGGWCELPAARAEVAFVPDAPDGVVTARFDLPAEGPLVDATGVVVQEILLATSGRVVAAHVDLDDPDQTVRFPTPSTTTTTEASATNDSAAPTTMMGTTTPTSTVVPGAATTTSAAAGTSMSTTSTAPAIEPLTPARPPTARPPRTIPRTGNAASPAMLTGGIALVMTGVGTLLVVRRARRRRRAEPSTPTTASPATGSPTTGSPTARLR